MKKQIYKPYDIDVEYEFKTYRNVGIDYGDSQTVSRGWIGNIIRFYRKKRNKNQKLYWSCDSYTEWKKHIYTLSVNRIVNFEDFLHWLYRKRNNAKMYLDSVKTILIPAYIAIISLIDFSTTKYEGQELVTLTTKLIILVVIIILSLGYLCIAREKVDFYEDWIGIMEKETTEHNRVFVKDDKKNVVKVPRMDKDKKNSKKLVVSLIGCMVLIPILIMLGTSADILNFATNDNDWIGFWGSYIGTIVGSLVTLVVLRQTINDNRKTRERAEDVEYYNHLIAIHSEFVSGIADYFTCITRTMAEKEDELYKESIHRGNRVSKVSVELSIRLCLKNESENVAFIIKKVDEIVEHVDEIGNLYDECARVKFSYMKKNDELTKKMDDVLEALEPYTNEFAECIKQELGYME